MLLCWLTGDVGGVAITLIVVDIALLIPTVVTIVIVNVVIVVVVIVVAVHVAVCVECRRRRGEGVGGGGWRGGRGEWIGEGGLVWTSVVEVLLLLLLSLRGVGRRQEGDLLGRE